MESRKRSQLQENRCSCKEEIQSSSRTLLKMLECEEGGQQVHCCCHFRCSVLIRFLFNCYHFINKAKMKHLKKYYHNTNQVKVERCEKTKMIKTAQFSHHEQLIICRQLIGD